MSNKNKVVSLRVEEAIYNELDKQAEAEGVKISDIVRDMIYAFVYSQVKHKEVNDVVSAEGDNITELLRVMENRLRLIKNSLHKTRGYVQHLEEMEEMFDNVYDGLGEQVKKGVQKISELKVQG